MRARAIRIGIVIGFWLAAVPVAQAWEIASFETDVAIHADASATVTETIIADFDGESRHGLYRDIPIRYTDRAGQAFTLRVQVRQVTDGSGHPWPYQLEPSGRYQRIRIGDPSHTVSGRQTYALVYDVSRGAVRFFPEHDECYWNLTGNEWAVPIRHVQARVMLPVAVKQLRGMAYVGAYGSTERISPLTVQPDRIEFAILKPLSAYEGATAVVAWEKGIVAPPSTWQVLRWWLRDNWVYGVPVLVLLGMLGLWWLKGRDPQLHLSEAVQYEAPDALSPAEVGTLLDERVDLRDITATVIDLAVRGYVRLEPLPHRWLETPDYTLVCLKTWKQDPAVKPHEHLMLDGLFGGAAVASSVKLSDLQSVFYTSLPDIRQSLYTGLTQQRYWDMDPRQVRSVYGVLAGLAGVALFLALRAIGNAWGTVSPAGMWIASGASAIIIFLMGDVMPRRTRKGAETTVHIRGFLEFLRRTDEDRIRRMNDPSLFERCLPYALAFGVARQWAHAFEGFYTQPPTWYAGDWAHFSAGGLARELDQTTASMGQTFVSQPRAQGGSWGGSGFGGGGFSGGGGGGGGGGAW